MRKSILEDHFQKIISIKSIALEVIRENQFYKIISRKSIALEATREKYSRCSRAGHLRPQYSESCEVKDSPSSVDITCELLPE